MQVELSLEEFIASMEKLFQTLNVNQRNSLLNYSFTKLPQEIEKKKSSDNLKVNAVSRMLLEGSERSRMNVY